MDVKFKLSMAIFLLLAACSDKGGVEDPTFKTSDTVCESYIVEGQYIAKWKDGRMSRIKASSKEVLLNQFVEPNRKNLEYVEHDTIIAIPAPVVSKDFEAQFLSPQWPHTAMRSEAAWSAGYYGEGVLVAVVDSGVDVNHPQLAHAIYTNTKEIPFNGIDDDGNGYVDDYKGYDFYTRSGDIKDQHGHGTHVAGIIAASHEADPNKARGLAPKAKILALNFMDEQGSGKTSDAISALYYARKQGAQVVNASWGSGECSQALKDTIESLQASGILVVAAAGNSGLNIDFYPNFPASFTAGNIISVAASTSRGLTADFSNYSTTSVDVAAPGKDIYSTIPNNQYAYFSGTSMAAPQVSALAALLWGARPNLRADEVKTMILQSVEGQFFPVLSRGEVDVQKAISLLP